MCGGVEFRRKKQDLGLGLLEAEEEVIRVLFPNPKAALRVDPDQDLWLPWGRRKEQAGDWPEGGWARDESLGKTYWTRWEPEAVVVLPARWMEKDPARRSHWFDLPPGQGLLCLKLHRAPGTPLYVVTEPSSGDYLEIHDRIPKMVTLP